MDTQKKLSIARFALRLVLAGTLGVFLIAAPVAWWLWAIAAASPHWSICSAVALRSVGLLAALCLPVLVAAVFVRRIFCRFACPVGLLTDLCGKLRPGRKPRIGKVPRLGQWLALASLGAAALGCPLFVWLDPLAIFGAAAGAGREPVTAVSLVPAAVLAAVLLVSFLVPYLWCGRLCPLGGTQDILADLGRSLRRPESNSAPTPKTLFPLARRTVLCAGAGGAWMLAIPKLFRGGDVPLRPPGSREEMAFKALCIRCGNCVRACPAKIIERDMDGQATSFLTPVIRYPAEPYTDRYCLDTCHECTQSCPSGAIERLTLEQKNRYPIGLAVIDIPECLLTLEQECGVCAEIGTCPQEAIAIEPYVDTIRIDPDKCNGCGACRVVCPVGVITIERTRAGDGRVPWQERSDGHAE